MSWLLPRLRPGSALRLGASRHALPVLSDAATGASPLQALSDGQAAYAAACSQQLRCLADGSQAAKPAAGPDEGAFIQRVCHAQVVVSTLNHEGSA